LGKEKDEKERSDLVERQRRKGKGRKGVEEGEKRRGRTRRLPSGRCRAVGKQKERGKGRAGRRKDGVRKDLPRYRLALILFATSRPSSYVT